MSKYSLEEIKKIVNKALIGGYGGNVTSIMKVVEKIAETSGNIGYAEFHSGIFYSPEFAMSFWGNDPIEFPMPIEIELGLVGHKVAEIPLWKWHQIQLMLAKDPIEYLLKFV